jgi:hypothetical protein
MRWIRALSAGTVAQPSPLALRLPRRRLPAPRPAGQKPARLLGEIEGPNGEIIDAQTKKVVVPAPRKSVPGAERALPPAGTTASARTTTDWSLWRTCLSPAQRAEALAGSGLGLARALSGAMSAAAPEGCSRRSTALDSRPSPSTNEAVQRAKNDDRPLGKPSLRAQGPEAAVRANPRRPALWRR